MNKKLVFSLALILISKLVFSQARTESLKINWPDEYKFKIGSDQDRKDVHLIELIPANQSIDDWKLIGSTLIYKGVTPMPIDTVPNVMFKEAQRTAFNGKLTIIEKQNQIKTPWIIFKIESSGFSTNPISESQLYYVIQGENSLYINFVAIKEKALPDDFTNRWDRVFKTSELVYK